MIRSKGFTLTELLVVISILVILTGLLLPVYTQARAAAREKQCWNNLHHLQLAFAIYRSDYGGDGVYGRATEMGLPPESAELPEVLNVPLSMFLCTAPPNVLSPTQAVYGMHFTDRTDGVGVVSWAQYVGKAGENAVLIEDMNHGDRSTPILSPFYSHRGIGVRLNGQIFTQTATGDWSDPSWWKN